ncbi:MAG: hypothetical protein EA374_06575 [Acholeplasmatales bacterium]|nr:MAG: hypothetical protein EA374_06575 [Acholeplasmatales bacterium]
MRLEKDQTSMGLLLASRIVLLVTFQLITTILVVLIKAPTSVIPAYWTVYVTLTNGVLFVWMLKVIGVIHYRKIFAFSKPATLTFIKWLPLLLIAAMAPNLALAYVLYGDIEAGAALLIYEHNTFMIVFNLTIFPILQGLTELPFYFLLMAPLLRARTHKLLISIGVPVILLSVQHMFMPFHLDGTYLVYRGFMFFGFALCIGILLYKRPDMLPYLVILHILMNASFMAMQFM